jgi:hypothetical protein
MQNPARTIGGGTEYAPRKRLNGFKTAVHDVVKGNPASISRRYSGLDVLSDDEQGAFVKDLWINLPQC